MLYSFPLIWILLVIDLVSFQNSSFYLFYIIFNTLIATDEPLTIRYQSTFLIKLISLIFVLSLLLLMDTLKALLYFSAIRIPSLSTSFSLYYFSTLLQQPGQETLSLPVAIISQNFQSRKVSFQESRANRTLSKKRSTSTNLFSPLRQLETHCSVSLATKGSV